MKLHVGEISPSKPLFKRPEGTKAKKIGSAKAKALKFEPSICQKCNNETTQPYDRSWETLSKYFSENIEQLEKERKWEPEKVFPGSSQKEMLNVQLFFAKIFGCRTVELGINANLSVLSKSILDGTPINRFYLSFGKTPGLSDKERYALETPVEVIENNVTGEMHAAFMFYLVGQIAIEIIYMPKIDGRPIESAWSPSNRKSKYICYRIID